MGEIIKKFETKYGLLNDVKVFNLSDSPVYILAQDIIISAGRLRRSSAVLKEQVKLRTGTILMPRQDKEYPGGLRWHLFLHGLYEALRACHHIRDHYEESDGEIVFTENAYRDFMIVAYQLASFRRLSDKEKEEIKQKLDFYQRQFRWVRDDLKLEVKEHLNRSIDLKDSLGRLNPGATAARLTASRRRLVLRLEQIQAIDPRIGRRQIALILEKDRIHRTLIDIQNKTARLASIANLCQKYLPNLDTRQLWRTRLIVYQSELTSILVAPYVAWIARLQPEISQLIDLMKNNKEKNLLLFKELAQRVNSALLFKMARWELEDIIFRYSIVFEAEDMLNEPERIDLHKEIDEFWQKKLAYFDETYFRFKVKEKIKAILDEAKSYLFNGPGKNGRLSKVKSLLKEAARIL